MLSVLRRLHQIAMHGSPTHSALCGRRRVALKDVIEEDFSANRQLTVNFFARCAIDRQSLLRLVAVVSLTALLAYGRPLTQSYPRSLLTYLAKEAR